MPLNTGDKGTKRHFRNARQKTTFLKLLYFTRGAKTFDCSAILSLFT